MKLLLAIAVLFAALTVTLPVKAADLCASHKSAVMKSVASDCQGEQKNSSGDCPDCCTQHHSMAAMFPMKGFIDVFPVAPADFVVTDDAYFGHTPSTLLRPPQAA